MDTGPEQVERCIAALERHGYFAKERRYGWLVTEPMGGRQRVESVEQLAAYTEAVVRREELATSKEEVYEAVPDNHVIENEGATGTYNMVYGAICAVVGVVITAVTYEAASEGGTYVVAYGAMGTGAVLFVAGLCQRFKYMNNARRGSSKPNRR